MILVGGILGVVLVLCAWAYKALNSRACPHCLSSIPRKARVCSRCCRDVEEDTAETRTGDDREVIALIKALEGKQK